MTKTKLYITFLFVTTLIGSCSKETNCDDVNCYPCPSYPSPYTLIAFENEGDSAFSQIDLDSNLIVFYTKNATDTFLPSKYTGNLFTINEEICRTPSFFGEIEYDSISLITENRNRYVFSEFKFKNITPKLNGCCSCPLYELLQVKINKDSFILSQLPFIIKKP